MDPSDRYIQQKRDLYYLTIVPYNKHHMLPLMSDLEISRRLAPYVVTDLNCYHWYRYLMHVAMLIHYLSASRCTSTYNRALTTCRE